MQRLFWTRQMARFISDQSLFYSRVKEKAALSTSPASSSPQSSFASCCPSASIDSCERITMSTREGGNPTRRGAAHTRGLNNTRGASPRGAQTGRGGRGRGTRGAPRGRGGRGGNRRGGYGTFGGNHRGDAPRTGSNGWLTTDDISGSRGPGRGGATSRGSVNGRTEPSVKAVNEPPVTKEKHPNGQPYIKISQIASVYELPALDIPLDCFRRVGVSIYAFEASRVTPGQLRAACRSHEMDETPGRADASGSEVEVGA
ncbi:hypothetical protein K523DRAFT_364190 [Schizophyllum commune Tattone D]|nr:hypothetical protein K523DRAFT_364190 [Schizophyllum commune Tattone D]